MKAFYSILLLFITLIACQKDNSSDAETSKTYSYLVSDKETKNFTNTTLDFLAGLIVDDMSKYTYTDVKGIEVIYNTLDEFKKPIEASGMLLIPNGFEGKGPLISYQHGTISSDRNAPTNSGLGENELSAAAVMSGIGAVVAIADYVGFGHSSEHQHPYLHKENTAQSTYDFLLAVEEYMDREKIDTNGELYLTGYSQGGHATLSLHQKIEAENKFQVTHSIPGAGAYNLTLLTEEILSRDEDLPFMSGYVWVLEVYNRVYPTLNRPFSFYYNEPYATRLSNLTAFNASMDMTLIHQNPQKLFKKESIDNILNGEDLALIEVMKQNSVHDWFPKAPITLFHGTADDYIFSSNPISAFSQIKANGGDINYIPLEDLDHQEAFVPYLLGALKIIFN